VSEKGSAKQGTKSIDFTGLTVVARKHNWLGWQTSAFMSSDSDSCALLILMAKSERCEVHVWWTIENPGVAVDWPSRSLLRHLYQK
jgi:hypothetical protein